jgi:hypothetical protein
MRLRRAWVKGRGTWLRFAIQLSSQNPHGTTGRPSVFLRPGGQPEGRHLTTPLVSSTRLTATCPTPRTVSVLND